MIDVKIIFNNSVKFLRNNVFNDENKTRAVEFGIDLKNSFFNVFKKTKPPTKQGLINFIFQEMIATSAGWTGGTIASDMLGNYFKTRGAQNLWGLKGRADGKTLITKEQYETYSWWAAYIIGLILLLLIRHFVIETIKEYNEIKKEKLKENIA